MTSKELAKKLMETPDEEVLLNLAILTEDEWESYSFIVSDVFVKEDKPYLVVSQVEGDEDD